MIVPVILSGGSGTRLWPLSRKLYPKQLIDLVDQHTMLQNTCIRLRNYENMGEPIILCNEQHRFMVAEQLRYLDMDSFSILLEPVGRNTAPALAIAALKTLSEGSDPILLVLPADHSIKDIPEFHNAIKTGEYYADKGHLITFGITPNTPETGYGYIKKGETFNTVKNSQLKKMSKAVSIEKFVEKPDYETAVKYLESGEYCWNSGMFMFKASVVIKELKKFQPAIVSACETSLRNGKQDLDFFRLDADSFKSSPNDSIDYAVMEKTDRGVMISLDAKWDDLGSWEALWNIGKKDKNNNVLKGDVLIHDVKKSLLHSTSRMIAAVGLDSHIVVETSDAVLITPRTRTQEVKKIVDTLKMEKRPEALMHRKIYRPWGSLEQIGISDRFLVNRIIVKPQAEFSLQKHFRRAEHWIILQGKAHVTVGKEQFSLNEDESTYIPIGLPHKLKNRQKIPLDLIEVQSGDYIGDDDIVRLENLYGK